MPGDEHSESPISYRPPRLDGVVLCAEVDPDLWFPEVGQSNKEAKDICRDCEVRDACLQWSLNADERYGVWGGVSATERSRLRKRKPLGRPESDIVHGTERGARAHERRGESACRACRDACNAAYTRRQAKQTAISCPKCKSQMQPRHLTRHLKRFHGDEAAA